jgi:hypothetical protein
MAAGECIGWWKRREANAECGVRNAESGRAPTAERGARCGAGAKGRKERMKGMRFVVASILFSAAGLGAAGAAGFARTFALPADGELAIVNTEQNAVWRPCVVSVICPSVATRTVTVYRVAGALEYPVAVNVAAARTYVYEFQGEYWSGLSNGVKVVVTPACTGTVEVVYE